MEDANIQVRLYIINNITGGSQLRMGTVIATRAIKDKEKLPTPHGVCIGITQTTMYNETGGNH